MRRADDNASAIGLVLGWEEWLSLPALGLAAIKAKIDTGARTSALHAFDIEPCGPAAAPMVRFSVHPVRARDDITVHCVAPVVDRREVISSNGERELRYVIETPVSIAGREWPIEITLTDRSAMSYRMLLGRTAIGEDMVIDPTSTFLQPRLTYRTYRGATRGRRPVRPLSIALLGDGRERATERAIVREALRRGHRIDHLDIGRAQLHLDGGAARIDVDGQPAASFDVVIPRLALRHMRRGIRVMRQLELLGAFSPNPSDALARCLDRFATAQHLVRFGVPVVAVDDGRAGPSAVPARQMIDPASSELRVLVIAGRAIARTPRFHPQQDIADRFTLEAEALACRSARLLGLGLAEVTVWAAVDGPRVGALTARPGLARYQTQSGVRATPALFALIEDRVLVPRKDAIA